MKRSRLMSLFLLLVLVQLAVPASMIHQRQATLSEGEPYKFRIGPVDPYDPFLGRYLVLNLEAANYEKWHGEPLYTGQVVFAVLERDRDGFARIRDVSLDAPGTRDYLRVRVEWQSGQHVRLAMPFSRYYLEEHAAQEAWRIQRNTRRQPVPSHILVRVRDGFGVLEELYFQDQPIFEYMRQRGLWPPGGVESPASDPAEAESEAAVPSENPPTQEAAGLEPA